LPAGRSLPHPGVILIAAGFLISVWGITLPMRARLARETAEIKRLAGLRSVTATRWESPSSSVDLARALVTKSPRDAGARLALAAALGKQGDDRAALSEAGIAAQLAPSSSGPHVALADLYDRVGEPDLALDELRKASAVAPLDTDATSRLAYKYLSFGWT